MNEEGGAAFGCEASGYALEVLGGDFPVVLWLVVHQLDVAHHLVVAEAEGTVVGLVLRIDEGVLELVSHLF